MASIVLADVAKSYPGKESAHILKGISFSIEDGEFVVLVGPSGCGKSTLLRMIAGLEEISGGEIRIDGERINETPPARRGLSMVFQNYALYAHMSVFENIAFGLRLAKVPKAEIHTAVRAVAKMLQLEHLLERRPPQLSGGQRQRVAIGRAIVRKPRAFLFDEPLSNLDAALRADMRVEIARLHKQLGATMVYVTHDQVEAMTLADRIVVLSPNGVMQIGSPMTLYERPANVFVAGFIGSPKMNLLPASVAEGALQLGEQARLPWFGGIPSGSRVTVGLRPEHLAPDPDGPLRGTVALIERLGAESYVHLNVAGLATPLVVALRGDPPREDSAWAVRPAAGQIHVFDEQGLRVDSAEPGGIKEVA
ncbi:ABC transporter ATP-binding protein [Massilia sp. LjRoot122]|uniref:ABC transporter ATP-binding protein n=1 Tax=Massilia sp. LjRoot122 TaxID=3342257 RepID=UPI003ECEB975